MRRNNKNPNLKTGSRGSQRIVHHGPGKGSADRTWNRAQYNANLSETNLGKTPVSQDPSFRKKGNVYRKVYGTARERKNTTNLKIEIR